MWDKRVWILVLVGLLAIETAARWARPYLSGDIRHLDRAPAQIDEMLASDGLKMLVLGNSLIGEALDLDAARAGLEEALDTTVGIAAVRPDGTTPLEWDYLIHKLVIHRDANLDVVVIGFGPGHLSDRPARLGLLRLAAHHVHRRDMGRLFRTDVTNLEERSQFLLASVWSSFALRDRVSQRVLAALIPTYTELAPELLRGPSSVAGSGSEQQQLMYGHLETLLGALRDRSVRVIAVAVPAPFSYRVQVGAMAVFEDSEVPVLDLNPVKGLDPVRFPDGVHLDDVGRARFTEVLVPSLAQALQSGDSGS